ncbi:transposase [Empedobacter stercoris]|uniref:transposase n=1 Tax=Empedobacter stercoris TaxID=1628248 RepID=UPI0039ED2D0E
MQNFPLESVYCIVWMDGIVFKVRQGGKVINKTIYLAVGLNREGHKEILRMWLGENESASFWQSVMTDLKARGVEDILITVTDNLNGFTGAITNIFPQANIQICVVHLMQSIRKFLIKSIKYNMNKFEIQLDMWFGKIKKSLPQT